MGWLVCGMAGKGGENAHDLKLGIDEVSVAK
jgi:hypothetical protein